MNAFTPVRKVSGSIWKWIFWFQIRLKGGAIQFPFRGDARYLATAEKVNIGRGVRIAGGAYLSVLPGATLNIGSRTVIGRDFVLSCARHVSIGEAVLFADRCFVADSNHEFKDVSRPVLDQGMIGGETQIGDHSWIGIQAAILANVKLGSHVIVGANAVVTKDADSRCVVAGNPARVIERFDETTGEWKKAGT